jgi:hypothetical protein
MESKMTENYQNALSEIFITSNNKNEIICPPKQVFKNPNFKYLLTLGGNIVNDENEYSKLMNVLKSIGETYFIIYENIGATETERNQPNESIIDVNSKLIDYEVSVKSFQPEPFGLTANHFYINGLKHSWGIYLCEYPTINIIGCIPELENKFCDVYNIENNGYKKIEHFINKEYKNKKTLLNELIINYQLK